MGPVRIDRRRATTLVAVIAVLALGVAAAQGAFTRWEPSELGPAREAAEVSLAAGEIRVVTWNGWFLHAVHRVAPLIDAIDRVGRRLGRGARDRPELIAIQEIQSEEVMAALRERFEEQGGTFFACACSRRLDGSIRGAVGAAVSPPLRAVGHTCVDLGDVWPDHTRCMVVVDALDERGERLDFAAVHLAWHVSNAPMARRMRDDLAARGALGARTIVAGDLNATPGSAAYAVLTAPPLADARPGAPSTHFAGGRLDYVLHGAGLEVVRAIDRRWTWDQTRPAARFTMPRACVDQGPPECPISDHLPEAVVVRGRTSGTLEAERDHGAAAARSASRR
jgi:endonuclease/exonuclease/phosphatase family metal-dependent hydrolase